MTYPELCALKAGDKVHRSTWRPHPCTVFTVQSHRDFEGKRFVFGTRGPGVKDNVVVTPVNCTGFHVEAECWATQAGREHAAAVAADLERQQAEQLAAITDESNL